MTEIQMKIAFLMGRAGVVWEACQRVIPYLETEEQQYQMLQFLEANPTATNLQVAYKLKEITK